MVVVPREGVSAKYRPFVTFLLITANVVIYLYSSLLGGDILQTSYSIISSYGLRPGSLFSDPSKWFLSIFTSMFIHADILHIFFNMYFLWIFGSRVEGFLGHLRFLLLYIASGISAVIFHVGFTPFGGVDSLVVPAVGASGAISGILGAYLLMLPYTKLTICMFFLLIPFCFTLPASAFLILWFAQQVIYGYLRLGGVAYFAHVGGFVMGILMAPYLVKKHYYTSESFIDYIYRYFYEYLGIKIDRPRGLGKGSRLLLTLIFIGIAIGFLYGAFMSQKVFINSRNIYISTLDVYINGETQSDQFMVLILGNKSISAIPELISPLDYVRIAGNRLLAVVYNPSMRGDFYFDNLNYTVIINNIQVPVLLENLRLRYNDLGIAISMEGSMKTRSVRIYTTGGVLGETITLDFKYHATNIDLTLLPGVCIIASFITMFSLTSIMRAEEAVIYQRLRIPEIYPHI